MSAERPDATRRAHPHIAVIGGGITGLAAALELVDSGASVTVCEADRFGGKLRTGEFAGRAVDEGADAFLARVPEAVALARSLGLGDELVAPATGRAHVLVDGTLEPLPGGHVLGVPSDPDAPDLLAVLGDAGVAALRRDRSDPGPPPPEHGDESVGSLIRRRLGDAVADRLVGPLVGGINAGNIDDLSLAAVTPQIDALARSRTDPSLVDAARAALAHRPSPSEPVFLAPTRGMSSLVDRLVATLTDRGATLLGDVAVRGIEQTPQGWRVIADDPGGRPVATATTVEADGLVLATPAGVSAAIVQDHAPAAGALLGSIRHASVALVTFAYPPGAIRSALDGSGFLVPRSEGSLCTAASWTSSKWAHLSTAHGDGTFLIRASAGRADDRRIAAFDDEALTETLADELARIMDLADAPVAARVSRWPSSFPQYAPGHLARVDQIEADLARRTPTVAVAGNALRGVGIPASIRSGQVAARTVLSALGAVPGR